MKNYVIIITVAFLGLLCLLGCITAHFYRQYELIVKTCNELQEQNDLMNDCPLTFQIFPDELCDGLYELPGFLWIPWLTDDGFSHISSSSGWSM